MRFVGLALDAPGDREARLRLVSLRGETHVYALVSPLIYRLSVRESMLFSAISRLIKARPRVRFFVYPQAYRIHRALAVVVSPLGMRGLHSVAPGGQLPTAFAAAAIRAQSTDDGSPAAVRERKAIEIPRDCLFRWFVGTCDGSQIDFLFARQIFAGSLIAFAFFAVLLRVPLPLLPSAMLFDDKRCVCMPNFLGAKPTVGYLPLTEQIAGMLPPFVLRGTAAADWHAIAEAVVKHKSWIKILLDAMVERQVGERILSAVRMVAPVAEEEAGGEQFAFRLFEHLVEASGDALRAQTTGFAWI
jgi:hypothetical protein